MDGILRGVSKSCKEQMVRLIEPTTDAAGERMEERRGGLLRPGRLVERFCVRTAAAPRTAEPLSSRLLAAVSSIL